MIRDTRSASSVWKMTWLPLGVTRMSTGESESSTIRATSKRLRAGMMISTFGSTLVSSGARRTESRYGSAAAIVTSLASNVVKTPVSTGRESSVAATNATSLIIRRSTPWAIRVVGLSGIAGMIGNSSASRPFMLASVVALLRCTVLVRTLSAMSIGPAGSELTKSVNSLAGTVIAPSSSIFAGTQQFTPISRLVAVSFSRPPSVLTRTFPRIGRVPRVETPRPTIERPRVRFSCRQLTFTRSPSTSLVGRS